jgi:hypothetical protein
MFMGVFEKRLIMKKYSCTFTLFAFFLSLGMKLVSADEQAVNLLPDSIFKLPVVSHGEAVPNRWHVYQWGPTGSKFKVASEANAGRGDGGAICAHNIEAPARAGVYTKVDIPAGTYRLSVWAKAQPGVTAHVRMYLGRAYSRAFTVGETWQKVEYTLTLSQVAKQAEINVQNVSGVGDSKVWFDDVELRAVNGVEYAVSLDTRAQRPRTLLFSPINVNYLKDTAPEWARRGFRGFLFDKIMYEWFSDVWKSDGDAQTRGADDRLLREVAAANKAARAVGIDSNFIKVSLRTALPDFFDDQAWEKITENFAQAARFARMSGCAGVAIDTEYIPFQYDPAWEGYQANPKPVHELKAKIRERWHHVVAGMLKEYPEMVFLTLPEGIRLYGELYNDMFEGMLVGMAEANAPGGMHLLTELTYSNTDAASLGSFANDLQATILEKLPASLHDYWKSRCSLSLGVWPFGYYREIIGPDGKPLGYSGRKEIFGDKIVGSYADKSARYSPQEFASQMAGVNTYSPRYNWVYGHGDVFTHMTPKQIAHYKTAVHQSLFNVEVPTSPNLEEYFKLIAEPALLVEKK